VPRTIKGKSSQLPNFSGRLPLLKTLEELWSLFNKWGLSIKDYVLVDEFAYVLQDYDVKATEVETGHIDVYVNSSILPWKDKGERSIIPPKDSIYMDNWITFMQETGYSLDMLRAIPEILRIPTVDLTLPNGKKIRLMRAFEMTEAFIQQTLMYYSLEDVDKEKIIEWMNKLEIIKSVAEKKNDEKLAEFCDTKLAEVRIKWQEAIPEIGSNIFS
jgi:hypothetical protein